MFKFKYKERIVEYNQRTLVTRGGLLPRTAGGYNDPGHQGEEGLYDAEKKHVLVVGPLRGEGGEQK